MTEQGRRGAITVSQSNPAEFRFDWRSSQKKFAFYKVDDKSKGVAPLPFKFLVLDSFSAVQGFDESQGASGTGIWSNEVKDLRSEPLTIRYNGGGVIAQGLYTDIKDQVKASKSMNYYKVLYILTPKGVIARLEVKGSAAFKLGDFMSKIGTRVYDEFISVEETTEHTKGSVTWNDPVFTSGGVIPDGFDAKAEEAYEKLKTYIKGKGGSDTSNAEQPTDQEPVSEGTPEWLDDASEVGSDDLPF